MLLKPFKPLGISYILFNKYVGMSYKNLKMMLHPQDKRFLLASCKINSWKNISQHNGSKLSCTFCSHAELRQQLAKITLA